MEIAQVNPTTFEEILSKELVPYFQNKWEMLSKGLVRMFVLSTDQNAFQ